MSGSLERSWKKCVLVVYCLILGSWCLHTWLVARVGLPACRHPRGGGRKGAEIKIAKNNRRLPLPSTQPATGKPKGRGLVWRVDPAFAVLKFRCKNAPELRTKEWFTKVEGLSESQALNENLVKQVAATALKIPGGSIVDWQVPILLY